MVNGEKGQGRSQSARFQMLLHQQAYHQVAATVVWVHLAPPCSRLLQADSAYCGLPVSSRGACPERIGRSKRFTGHRETRPAAHRRDVSSLFCTLTSFRRMFLPAATCQTGLSNKGGGVAGGWGAFGLC